jgi:hypothetical protein
MILDDKELTAVENAVLEVLDRADNPYAPKALIEAVVDLGYPDGIVRTAIWYLVDKMLIRLTPEFDFARGSASRVTVGA